MGIEERMQQGERAGAKRCGPQGCFIDAGAVAQLCGFAEAEQEIGRK